MLFTPGNDFGWSVDNYGSTYTDAGLGLDSPGHANANTKGANTAMLGALAEDCYGISIGFSGQSLLTVARRVMVDLLIDPAGGTSWSVIINNLYANSPTFGTAGNIGCWYYFPLYLMAGTAIGTAHQNLVAGTLPLRVFMRVYGKPSRPDLLRCGTKVQTLGATIGTTTGVAVTPGTSAMGSYSATLGTLTADSWWWQVGFGSNDTTMTANAYLFDVAVNATNKIVVSQGTIYHVGGNAETSGKTAFPQMMPASNQASGQDVYVRGAAAAAPDATMTAIVYALGG